VSGPNILVLDVETAPILAYTWGIWQQNVGLNQIVRDPRMLCWGAKWHGHKDIHFASEYHDGREDMLLALHELINEADFIVGWNSARFDRPWIDGEFDKLGLGPAAPARDIDLMKVAKRQFRLPSYKLDYVAQKHYGLKGKVAHQGFTLWSDAIDGDEATKAKAWKKMKSYQLGDIRVTDRVFSKMKPWIRVLPNFVLWGEDGDPDKCACGSTRFQRRGYNYTKVSRYQRFQCQGCGAWFQGGRREAGVDLRRAG